MVESQRWDHMVAKDIKSGVVFAADSVVLLLAWTEFKMGSLDWMKARLILLGLIRTLPIEVIVSCIVFGIRTGLKFQWPKHCECVEESSGHQSAEISGNELMMVCESLSKLNDWRRRNVEHELGMEGNKSASELERKEAFTSLFGLGSCCGLGDVSF